MCKTIFWIFTALYVVALGLFVVGYFGLFGSPSGPLDGIFLVPLGLPWNLAGDYVPESARLWFGIGAPFINLVILRKICRAFGSARS